MLTHKLDYYSRFVFNPVCLDGQDIKVKVKTTHWWNNTTCKNCLSRAPEDVKRRLAEKKILTNLRTKYKENITNER